MRLKLRFTGPRGGPTLLLPEDPADPDSVMAGPPIALPCWRAGPWFEKEIIKYIFCFSECVS